MSSPKGRKSKRPPKDGQLERQSTRRVSQEPRTDRWLRAILTVGLGFVFFVIFAAIVLVVWHDLIQFEHESSPNRQGVLLLASYPRFLSTDDQGGVVITVVNTGQNSITDTTVSLVYNNAKYVSMDIDSTSLVRFGALEPSERKTKLIKFQVNRIDSANQKLQIDLNLSAEISTTVTNTVTNTLRIGPTINSWLPPMDVSALVLSRKITIPNFTVALVTVLASVKMITDVVKAVREFRNSDSEKQSSS